MQLRRKLLITLCGGIICVLLGSLLGAACFVLAFVEKWSDLLPSLALIPMMTPVGFLIAAPFGIVFGSIGTWWLIERVLAGVSRRRTMIECLCAGAALGLCYPVFAFATRPSDATLLFSGIAVITGSGCGLSLAAMLHPEIART